MNGSTMSGRLAEHLGAWQRSFQQSVAGATTQQFSEIRASRDQLLASIVAGVHSANSVNDLTTDLTRAEASAVVPPKVRIGTISFTSAGVEVPLTMPFGGNLVSVIALADQIERADALNSYIIRALLSFPPFGCRITVIGTPVLGAPSAAFDTLPPHLFRRLQSHRGGEIEEFLDRHTASSERDDLGAVRQPFHLVCVPNYPEGLGSKEAEMILTLASERHHREMFVVLSVDPTALDDSNQRTLMGQRNALRQYSVVRDDSLVFRDSTFAFSNRVRMTIDRLPDDRLVRLVQEVRLNHNEYVSMFRQGSTAPALLVNVERLMGPNLQARIQGAIENHPLSDFFFTFSCAESIKTEFPESTLGLELLARTLQEQAGFLEKFVLKTLAVVRPSTSSIASETAMCLHSTQTGNLCLLLLWEVVAGNLTIDILAACVFTQEPGIQQSNPLVLVKRLQEMDNHQLARQVDVGRTMVLRAIEQILSSPRRPKSQRELI